jgi:hypothetical protein
VYSLESTGGYDLSRQYLLHKFFPHGSLKWALLCWTTFTNKHSNKKAWKSPSTPFGGDDREESRYMQETTVDNKNDIVSQIIPRARVSPRLESIAKPEKPCVTG